MAKNRSKIKASNINNSSILGFFEGECADSNITNLNGLDITRDVWEYVFNSDEYKHAIECGFYIGFLGHPEDPGCQDFEHACIVMVEGHIDADGKVYGKFKLVDTPVGRIVKAFIDAGVKFGISVRGAGDIINNSVDPESFVFRGFDLVSFPAFPKSIPKFTEVAASSDIELQKNYKKVCAAVETNIEGLNTVESVNILQSQFASQSDTYKLLENKKQSMIKASNMSLEEQKVASMTELYLDAILSNTELTNQVNDLKKEIDRIQECNRLKVKSLERITSSQISELDSAINDLEAKNNKLRRKNSIMSSRCLKLKDEIASLTDEAEKYKYKCSVMSSKLTDVKSKLHTSEVSNQSLEEKVDSLKNKNLIYKQKIDASENTILEKDDTISGLRKQLGETVTAAENAKNRTSNLDEYIVELESKIEASQKLVQGYQDAYAAIYANALGVHLDNIVVTPTTSVEELQSRIKSKTSITSSEELSLIDIDGTDDLVTL